MSPSILAVGAIRYCATVLDPVDLPDLVGDVGEKPCPVTLETTSCEVKVVLIDLSRLAFNDAPKTDIITIKRQPDHQRTGGGSRPPRVAQRVLGREHADRAEQRVDRSAPTARMTGRPTTGAVKRDSDQDRQHADPEEQQAVAERREQPDARQPRHRRSASTRAEDQAAAQRSLRKRDVVAHRSNRRDPAGASSREVGGDHRDHEPDGVRDHDRAQLQREALPSRCRDR